jgi:O-antigen/teichoic acid export membrane protein
VFIGNLLTQGLNFLTMLLLTRFFGKSTISLYAVTISLLTLLIAISDSGIGNSVVKFLNQHKGEKDRINSFLKTGLYFRFVTGLIIALSGLYVAEVLALNFYKNTALYMPFLISFFGVIVLTLHSYVAMKMQAEEKFISRSIFLTITAILRFVSVLIVVVWAPNEMNLIFAVLIYISSPLVLTILYSKQIIEVMKLNIERSLLFDTAKQLFNYSKWMFLSMLAVLLIMRLDQFMLLKLSSPEETSIYVVATQVAMILPLFADSLNTVLLPKITKYNMSLNKYRMQLFKRLGPFCLLLLSILELLSPLLPILFGKEYQDSIPVLRILILAFVIGIILNPLSLIFHQRSQVYYLTALNYIQLILMFCFNYLLIPLNGAIGAAISSLLVRVVSLIYVLIISNMIIKKGEIDK